MKNIWKYIKKNICQWGMKNKLNSKENYLKL